jgi:hypothetical protein
MAAYEYAFTLDPRGARRARSFATACAAIAAVCVLSSAVVMHELVGAAPARATPATIARTTAQTWDLEPRWWPGPIRQVTRPAPTVPDSDLTFAKGYAQRVAARQAVLAARVAPSEPAAESQAGRTAIVRKATAIASTAPSTDAASSRRTPAPRIDMASDRVGHYDLGNRALAFDAPRPSRHGDFFGNLFGNLY